MCLCVHKYYTICVLGEKSILDSKISFKLATLIYF